MTAGADQTDPREDAASGLPGTDAQTSEEKRRDQFTSAPDAEESDAAPRVEVTRRAGVTRVDVAEDAPVRPGPGPRMAEADGAQGGRSRRG